MENFFAIFPRNGKNPAEAGQVFPRCGKIPSRESPAPGAGRGSGHGDDEGGEGREGAVVGEGAVEGFADE
jgi:hypothetical protein